MKLVVERIKALANYCNESTSSPSFSLVDEENVKTACIIIAQAGIPIDMEYFMDAYYFNFKSKQMHDKAVALIAKKINQKKEPDFKS